MTPKEKAKELVDKFKVYSYSGRDEDNEWRFENAKQCALIAVDELIELSHSSILISTIKYWQEVRKEIEKF